MTESTHEERVQESGVVGHSYDTDDRIGDLDIYEALVNPHDEHSGGQKKGAGGPTMMPMGGAGSGAGSSSGTSSGTSGVPASAAKGTSAASAGTGGAGVSGLAGAGFGASGLGAGGLSGAGSASAGLSGLSSGLGSGGLSSGGSAWGLPSSGTGAAGITDPTLDLTGSGTGSTGGITIPTVPTSSTPTIPTPTVPGTGGTTPSPIKMPSTTVPSTSGIKAPSTSGGSGGGIPGAGGGGGGGANTSNLGVKTVKASPEMLHQEAQHWDDTSHQFAANVTNPVGNQSPSSVDFGMMKDAFPSYNDLLNRLKKWSTEAGTEFAAISDALQSASGGYSDTEATNTATATQTGSSKPE